MWMAQNICRVEGLCGEIFLGPLRGGGGAVVVKIPCGDEEFFGHGELRGPNFMSHAYMESPFKI